MPHPQVGELSGQRIGIQRQAIGKNARSGPSSQVFGSRGPRKGGAPGRMVGSASLDPREALSAGWIVLGTRDGRHDCVRKETLGGPMIDTGRIRKAMHEMAAQKGDFTLFALLRRAEAVGGMWDLVVSAPWFKNSTLAATQEVVDLLTKSMGRKALLQFSRIVVLAGDDPTVRFFLKNVPVEDGERGIQSTDLFGMQIEQAIIFRAKRPERVRPRGKVARSTLSAASQRRA